MGKNNRARRAAKAKRRASGRDQRSAGRDRSDGSTRFVPPEEPIFTTAELADWLLHLGGTAPLRNDDASPAAAIERLCALDRSIVQRRSEQQIVRMVAASWNEGWQPAELARQVRRTTNATTASLALVAIAADRAPRASSTLDARWIAQLGQLDLPPVADATAWLAGWADHEHVQWPDVVGSVVTLLQCLVMISPIPILIPPPGTNRGFDTNIDSTSTNDPILDRVRALLAQAESTTFEAEAEAFTAKAQDLMTRHAIDVAMVSARAQRSERPITMRLPIDESYIDAKSLLLQCVAESSRCRSVFHQRFAMSSIVGFSNDVAATEMLFTSLLVQAQTAVRAAAASAPAGARARSRSFRAAFLVAYANRVAERLAEINATVVADVEAEATDSILPVLAARSSVVDDVVGEMFGELRETLVRGGHDAAGWMSGRMAADRAQLNFGDLTESGCDQSAGALAG